MRCNKAKDRIAQYIDGALTGKDKADLELHLRSCAECAKDLDSLRELDSRLKRDIPQIWQGIEPASGFMARLRQMDLDPETSRGSDVGRRLSMLWGRHRLAFATGLSVCLVVVLAISGIVNFDSSGDDDDESMIMSESAAEFSVNGDALSDMSKGSGVLDEDDRGSMIPPPAPSSSTAPDEVPLPQRSDSVLGGTAAEETGARELAATAIRVALDDSRVRAHISHQGYDRVEVLNLPVIRDDFDCLGLTVVVEQPDIILYVCVDLETRQAGTIAAFHHSP